MAQSLKPPKTPEQIAEEIARLKTVCGYYTPGNTAPSHRREDIFAADPQSQSLQGPLEIVRLGRRPGGGIRRL